MERREACRLLGVEDDVDLATVKQRFRELARDHHPDHGGDPVLFGAIRQAFALLRDELGDGAEPPGRPLVSRGRPSRPFDDAHAARRVDDAALDPAARALAERLTTTRTCRYVSRAPGARTNRIAVSLSLAATSSLHVGLRVDAHDERVVTAHVELTARPRAARRAVTRLDVARLDRAGWVRHRGDAMTALRTDLRAVSEDGTAEDGTAMGRRTAAVVVELLDALAWPLEDWSLEAAAR